MLREVANISMGLGDSLLLSGIGMLVVFMELIILALMIRVMSKVISSVTGKSKEAAPAVAVAAPAAVPAAPALCAAPALTLTDVSEPAAAAVMAIVSDKTGIPLSRLAFHSIKGVIEIEGATDEEAAVIMALTADKIGVPVNKLVFKSIKKI